jgi:hypothetical protein
MLGRSHTPQPPTHAVIVGAMAAPPSADNTVARGGSASHVFGSSAPLRANAAAQVRAITSANCDISDATSDVCTAQIGKAGPRCGQDIAR